MGDLEKLETLLDKRIINLPQASSKIMETVQNLNNIKKKKKKQNQMYTGEPKKRIESKTAENFTIKKL